MNWKFLWLLTIFFVTKSLQLHSICPKDFLVKNVFFEKVYDFVIFLDYEQIQLVCLRDNFVFFVLMRKFLVFRKKVWWFSKTEFQPSEGSLWGKFFFWSMKFFEWLCISGRIFGIVAEAAFKLLRQTYWWKRFYSIKRSICHRFCSWANRFATWQVGNGGFIKSDFFFSVVSLEKIFIF